MSGPPRGGNVVGKYVRIVDQVTQARNRGVGMVVSKENAERLWRLLTQLEAGELATVLDRDAGAPSR